MDKASNDDTVMEVVEAVEVCVEVAPGVDPEVVVKVLVNVADGSSVLVTSAAAGLAVGAGVGVAKRGFSRLPPPGT